MRERSQNRRLFPIVALTLVAALVGACEADLQGGELSGTPGAPAAEQPGPDGAGDAGPGPYDGDPASGPGAELAGRWGQLLNVTIIQHGLPLLQSSWVAARNWYLVDISTDGEGNLTTREQLCSIQLKLDTDVNHSIVPQRFIDHVPPVERRITVDSAAAGTPWISDRIVEVRGANLCDPEHDPLPPHGSAAPDEAYPCEAGCGGHCDQDEDGHPGMTSILSGFYNCELYVVQRWWSRLDGEIVDGSTISGAVTDHFSEQDVVAASTAMCTAGQPVASMVDCPEQQYFELVRLPDDATCVDVLELTDCDESPADCDHNDVLPLDPDEDLPTDCE